MNRRTLDLALPLALLLSQAVATSPARAAGPPPGQYDGVLCVSTSATAEPECGPAEVRLSQGGRVRVQISDIVYRLQLHSSHVDVVTMHNAVQIDAFTADYDWAGRSLQFTNAQKRVRYELRLPDTTRRVGV